MSKSDAYERKGEAKVEEMEAELKKLKAKSKDASADAQIEMEKKIDELQGKIERARN